jgi:hypothetical protein
VISAVIVLRVLAVLLLAGVIRLIPLGLRAGDRGGDALLLKVEPRIGPRGATVTVLNRGGRSVMLGMSLRRAGPRLRLEGGSYVRVRTGSTSAELRAGRQTGIAALDAGETETFVVPASAQVSRRAELVLVVGQSERLRTIHRLIVLPRRDLSVDDARHEVRKPGLDPLER